MKVAIGADHGGFELKQRLAGYLQSKGHQVLDLGTSSHEVVDYPIFARTVAEAVASGSAERGIMVDGRIGSAMVANKLPGCAPAWAMTSSAQRRVCWPTADPRRQARQRRARY
jgi:ribose 5-phosphate isomerase B